MHLVGCLCAQERRLPTCTSSDGTSLHESLGSEGIQHDHFLFLRCAIRRFCLLCRLYKWHRLGTLRWTLVDAPALEDEQLFNFMHDCKVCILLELFLHLLGPVLLRNKDPLRLLNVGAVVAALFAKRLLLGGSTVAVGSLHVLRVACFAYRLGGLIF